MPSKPRVFLDSFFPRPARRWPHLAAALALLSGHVWAHAYDVVIDSAVRPPPGPPPAGWYFNEIGGDRGVLASGLIVSRVTAPQRGLYRAECVSADPDSPPAFVGLWEAFNRPVAVHQAMSPQAVFPPLIQANFQGRLTSMSVEIPHVTLTTASHDARLALELKGWDDSGAEITVARQVYDADDLLHRKDRLFTLPVDPACAAVGVFAVTLEQARPGDAIDIGPIRASLTLPAIAARLEPFLFAYADLLYAYDPASGLVQDRARYRNGVLENVTATAKLAKLIAMAIDLGVTDPVVGRDAIATIAATLINRVPRGPAGLWPHFTTQGGSDIAPGAEWSSGDTAFSLLDLLVALRLAEIPGPALGQCQHLLDTVAWRELLRVDGSFAHGYRQDGTPLDGYWAGFGMETLGVDLAALAGGGPLGRMLPPDSDNGSGFILHAAYPIPASAKDRWGNDWGALRRAEVEQQIGWYAGAAHANPTLQKRGWFGLSAGERPEGWDPDPTTVYQAYGLPGRLEPARDGDHRVVVVHYSGMVAALTLERSLAMWESLKARHLASPFNVAESIAVSPTTGQIEAVNFLEGSWNLALFAEGWGLAQAGEAERVRAAMLSIPSLAHAWATLFPAHAGKPLPATRTASVPSPDEVERAQPTASKSPNPSG